MEPLLHADGSRFDNLEDVRARLGPLENDARVSFRDRNAAAIAATECPRLLVVAGPGAGKSHLFLARIRYWLERGATNAVYVATFVRKLVKDLEADLDRTLDAEQRRRVQASTLHGLARSILARSGGTPSCSLGAYVRVIDRMWAGVVWDDVRAFRPETQNSQFAASEFDAQLHTEEYDDADDWRALRETYTVLSSFYNAVGFASLIVFAREAIETNPRLVLHSYWILDEYQDFNRAEDHLILVLTNEADGVLLAGDDEQALYIRLKASKPEIIIGYYNDAVFAKAMLPFCSRCSYYICAAASSFMATHRGEHAIEKVYLPLVVDEEAARVRWVAAATPETEIDYIRKFLEDRAGEYEKYLVRRAAGEDTDPFLLILSQSGGLTLSKQLPQEAELRELVAAYAGPTFGRSASYQRVLAYAAAGAHQEDNYAVRKLLHYEGLDTQVIHELLVDALENHRSLEQVAIGQHASSFERSQRVAEMLEATSDDQSEAAAGLAEILGLSDDASLALELTEHPIGVAGSREAEDEAAIDAAPLIDPVALMAITGSKGLSAHHVIILGCDDANLQYADPLMFFVALTRARQSLHLVVAAKAAGSKGPHRYIADIPEAYCDYVLYKKTGRVLEDLRSREAFLQRFGVWERVKSRFSRKGG